MYFTSSECRLFVEDAYVYRKREKKRFPSMYYTSKSRDGIRHIANSSHVYRVTSLHSFPRWFILTTNRSVLEILSLEAYQNVRNVLRLIVPRIHLSRRSPHPLFAFGFRWTVSSCSGSECEHNFVNFFLIVRLRIFMPMKRIWTCN